MSTEWAQVQKQAWWIGGRWITNILIDCDDINKFTWVFCLWTLFKVILDSFLSLFFSVCFQMPPKFSAREHVKLPYLHLPDFPRLCIFIYENAQWRKVRHIYVSLNLLPDRVHTHTCCICFAFLHCVFSNVSSNPLPDRMQSHIGALSGVSSNDLPERMRSLTGCICLVFSPLCIFKYIP